MHKYVDFSVTTNLNRPSAAQQTVLGLYGVGFSLVQYPVVVKGQIYQKKKKKMKRRLYTLIFTRIGSYPWPVNLNRRGSNSAFQSH